MVYYRIVWLILTLFEPVAAYFDAIAECVRKYGPSRAHRTEIYEELAAMHQQRSVYQQMAQ